MSNSSSYFATRGCYYRVLGDKESPQFYQLNPKMDAPCPVLYNDVVIQGRDHVAKQICFNGIRNAAIVSKDFGEITIAGIALLGSVENAKQFGSAFKKYVEQIRVYNYEKECMISSKGSGAWKFLCEAYQLGRINPEYNIQDFSLGGALID